jgi:hypothetical protein
MTQVVAVRRLDHYYLNYLQISDLMTLATTRHSNRPLLILPTPKGLMPPRSACGRIEHFIFICLVHIDSPLPKTGQ